MVIQREDEEYPVELMDTGLPFLTERQLEILQEEERFRNGVIKADMASLESVVRCALVLEQAMYAGDATIDAVYCLRKSLEGIWGHELPRILQRSEEGERDEQ